MCDLHRAFGKLIPSVYSYFVLKVFLFCWKTRKNSLFDTEKMTYFFFGPQNFFVPYLTLTLVDNVKRGRSRSKLTWDKSVKRDLNDWNISKEIALDRSAWRIAINVLEPWTYFFRVSSLAYPNLLGKKRLCCCCCCVFACWFRLQWYFSHWHNLIFFKHACTEEYL